MQDSSLELTWVPLQSIALCNADTSPVPTYSFGLSWIRVSPCLLTCVFFQNSEVLGLQRKGELLSYLQRPEVQRCKSGSSDAAPHLTVTFLYKIHCQCRLKTSVLVRNSLDWPFSTLSIGKFCLSYAITKKI